MNEPSISRTTALQAALLAGLAASACCVLPLVLLWLGISGAWIANLTALSKFHTELVVIAVSLLALSYYLIFMRKVPECDGETKCRKPIPSRVMRIGFWAAALIILIAVAFPYLASYLY